LITALPILPILTVLVSGILAFIASLAVISLLLVTRLLVVSLLISARLVRALLATRPRLGITRACCACAVSSRTRLRSALRAGRRRCITGRGWGSNL
jgi:hypothetical protein